MLILVWISKATPLITIQERRYAEEKGRKEGRKGKGRYRTSVIGSSALCKLIRHP